MPQVATLVAAAPSAAPGGVGAKFSALGMPPGMVEKFTPFILEYLKTGTTPQVMSLVQAALLP